MIGGKKAAQCFIFGFAFVKFVVLVLHLEVHVKVYKGAVLCHNF